jgi:hypothetical protein
MAFSFNSSSVSGLVCSEECTSNSPFLKNNGAEAPFLRNGELRGHSPVVQNVPLLFIIRFTVSDYSFGIFWSLCCLSFDLWLLIIPLVSSRILAE